MNKEAIQKIRIDILTNEQSALSMLLSKEGQISRQGSGKIPVDMFTVTSADDGTIFNKILEKIDDRAFEHAGVYDHPDKQGETVTMSVAFLGDDSDVTFFEFRYGTETKDVGQLLPFFDQFVSYAVIITDEWYRKEKSAAQSGDAATKDDPPA